MAEYINFKELEQENLTCAICLETYTDPKMLDCAHSFCLSCLNTFIDKQKSQGYKKNCVKCPQCRNTTSLPQNGVTGLKSNFLLNSILEMKKKFPEDQCGSCVRREKAVAMCQECSLWLCYQCRESHPMMKSTLNHTILSTSGIKILSLEEENKQMRTSSLQLQEKIMGLEKKLSETDDNFATAVENLVQKISDLDDMNTNLRHKGKSDGKRIKSQGKKLSKLHSELETMALEKTQLETAAHHLHQKDQDLRKEYHKIYHENVDLQERMASVEKEKNECETTVQYLSQENAWLRRRNQSKIDEILQKKEKIASLEDQNFLQAAVLGCLIFTGLFLIIFQTPLPALYKFP